MGSPGLHNVYACATAAMASKQYLPTKYKHISSQQ